MAVEQKEGGIPFRQNLAGQEIREAWRRVLNPIVRTEVTPSEHTGLEEALTHVANGGSLILFSKHRSRIDPLAVLLALYNAADGALKGTQFEFPIGDHQKKLLGIDLAKVVEHAGVGINPIVTESTLKKRKAKINKKTLLSKIGPVQTPDAVRERLVHELPEENTGFVQFAASAESALKQGGVVYLPTQSERSPLLPDVKQGERTLGNMAALVKRKRIQHVGILFVDVSTAAGDKKPDKKGGLDLFRLNRVKFGPFYTLEDAVARAGKIQELDSWAVRDIMTELVDPRYLSPQLRELRAYRKYLAQSNERKAQEAAQDAQMRREIIERFEQRSLENANGRLSEKPEEGKGALDYYVKAYPDLLAQDVANIAGPLLGSRKIEVTEQFIQSKLDAARKRSQNAEETP
ncbi:MAG: hypothetical protein ACM3IJ_05715 [Candidatus Levyibacteriota bacterium]